MTSTRYKLQECVLAAALGWLLATTAAADDRRGAGPALEEGQSHRGPMLRGAELRACVKLDRELDAIDTRIRILKGPVDAAEWTHELKARSLDADAATLDRTDSDAVARYNRRVDEHAAAVAAYNALLPEFNAVVGTQGELVDRFNARCTERAYYIKEWNTEDVRQHHEEAATR